MIPTSGNLSTLKTITIPRRSGPFLHPIVIHQLLPTTTLPRDQTTPAPIPILPIVVCKAATTTTILKVARLHLTEDRLATIVLDAHHLIKATTTTTVIKATTPTGVAEEDIWSMFILTHVLRQAYAILHAASYRMAGIAHSVANGSFLVVA